jgi:AcrR family transcriptional regulator
MSAVARATGISRQALYRHFPDRSALLLAVVEHVDACEGLDAAIAEVQAAADGPAQVRAWADMQARRNPRIASLARALDPSFRGCGRRGACIARGPTPRRPPSCGSSCPFASGTTS